MPLNVWQIHLKPPLTPMPRYTPIVAALPSTVPFVGPETQERARGAPFAARLGANESVFGPSPKAIAAIINAAQDIWQYADPENHDLKSALSKHHGVGVENIVVGEGIDGLLGTLVRLVVEPGVPVVTSDGAYPTFNFHVAASGGALTKVPYRDDHEDLDALADAVEQTGAALVYLANPDNPMGSWLDADAITAFVDRIPKSTIICLDEAYVDFAPDGAVPALDVARTNLIRMRTFSKGYGLAGLRIGYALAHADLALAFNKIRNHFGVNRLAQAGALSALEDQLYLEAVKAKVAKAKDRISAIARDNGLTPLPSATNFVTVDCGGDDALARAVVEELGREGVFIRMPFAHPGNRCIRISAGRDEDLDTLAEALPKALARVRGGLNIS